MRALVIAVLAWVGIVVTNAHNIDVSPGNGRDSGISFHGQRGADLNRLWLLPPHPFYNRNWKNTTDDCGPAFVTNTIGDGLAYSFKGVAVYVYGTIACGWKGLINISVDGVFNATINRENCDAVPANGTRAICRYPWMSKDGLDPNVEHTLTLTLVGPSLRENPSGNVVAELRSIRYTVPITTSAAVASSTDDYDWTPDETTVTSAPTASSESADSPLPQLASLRLSTAATCGIIIGIILFFLFALAVCIVLRRRSNQRRRQASMAGMIGPRTMVSQAGRRHSRHSRYPTEHLSWSPAAERLEEAKAQQAASGRRSSGGSVGSAGRSSWSRRRMDSIPESDWEQHNADHHSSGPAALAGVIAGSSRSPRDEKGGFSWGSPPSSPGGRERKESEQAAFYVSNSIPSPSPSTRLAFPSLAASGDYWSRRTSRSSGGRFAPLPASPLRTSMVAEDGELRPGS